MVTIDKCTPKAPSIIDGDLAKQRYTQLAIGAGFLTLGVATALSLPFSGPIVVATIVSTLASHVIGLSIAGSIGLITTGYFTYKSVQKTQSIENPAAAAAATLRTPPSKHPSSSHGARGPAASSKKPAVGSMAGIKGISNKGNECFLATTVQYLIATQGIDNLAEKLKKTNKIVSVKARKTLLDLLSKYKRKGSFVTGDDLRTLRRVLATEGTRRGAAIGGTPSSTAKQHPAGEVITGLIDLLELETENHMLRTTRLGARFDFHGSIYLEAVQKSADHTAEVTLQKLFDNYFRSHTFKPGKDKGLTIEIGGYDDITKPFHSIPLRSTLGRSLYEADAVVIHRGSTPRFGHYFACIKRDGKWYEANDSRVTRLSDAKIQEYLTPSAVSRPTVVHYSKRF